jgi:hypothetical protein
MVRHADLNERKCWLALIRRLIAPLIPFQDVIEILHGAVCWQLSDKSPAAWTLACRPWGQRGAPQ